MDDVQDDPDAEVVCRVDQGCEGCLRAKTGGDGVVGPEACKAERQLGLKPSQGWVVRTTLGSRTTYTRKRRFSLRIYNSKRQKGRNLSRVVGVFHNAHPETRRPSQSGVVCASRGGGRLTAAKCCTLLPSRAKGRSSRTPQTFRQHPGSPSQHRYEPRKSCEGGRHVASAFQIHQDQLEQKARYGLWSFRFRRASTSVDGRQRFHPRAEDML